MLSLLYALVVTPLLELVRPELIGDPSVEQLEQPCIRASAA